MRYRNRTEAGRLLAQKLAGYANRADVLVLALPRGGVPVAFEVAVRRFRSGSGVRCPARHFSGAQTWCARSQGVGNGRDCVGRYACGQ
jgi:hypothetical protein